MLLPTQLPAASAQLAAPRAYSAPPAALSRGQLGLAFDSWRATPYGATAVCAPQAGAVRTCRIAAAPLGGAYRARDLAYTFRDGRLARIAFDASIDALPYATALVKAQFGAPGATVRDRIQTPDGAMDHLAYSWSRDGASARLSDPTRASDRLQVVMDQGSTATGGA